MICHHAKSSLYRRKEHLNNPAPRRRAPAGQGGRYEEALVRQLTDHALPSYNLPKIFGLPDRFDNYLNTAPPQGTDLRTGARTNDYGHLADGSTISQLNAASLELSGWDCSRIK